MEGSFTYRRSPDYNPFSEFNLEDQFRGVSSGLSEWIVDKLSSRNITDMTVQQNSQTVIDWLTHRLDLDPSGTIGAGSFDVSFPEIMLPDSGASLDVPLPTVMMPSSDRLPEAPAARPAASFMMPNGSTDSEPRTLEINVNGQGAIKVDGAISADRAAEIASQQIADQAKDVLLGIIKQEMTEEGDRSYVY